VTAFDTDAQIRIRSCGRSSAGGAIWPRHPGDGLMPASIDLVGAWPSRGGARRRRPGVGRGARDRPRGHFDVRIVERKYSSLVAIHNTVKGVDADICIYNMLVRRCD
jgi:hypothetical protein